MTRQRDERGGSPGRVAVFALVAAAALGLGACSGSSRPVEVSHADFMRIAQETCAASARAVSHVAKPDPGDPKAMAAAIQQVVRLQRDALTDLAGISPPAASRDEVQQWLALVSRVLNETDTAVSAWIAGDAKSAGEAVARANERNAAAEDLARALGLSSCAGPAPAAPAPDTGGGTSGGTTDSTSGGTSGPTSGPANN